MQRPQWYDGTVSYPINDSLRWKEKSIQEKKNSRKFCAEDLNLVLIVSLLGKVGGDSTHQRADLTHFSSHMRIFTWYSEG